MASKLTEHLFRKKPCLCRELQLCIKDAHNKELSLASDLIGPMMPANAFKVMLLGLIPAAFAVTACTRVPEIEDNLSTDLRSADYPALLPLEKLVTPLPVPAEQSAKLEEQLNARTARLKAQAEALKAAQN